MNRVNYQRELDKILKTLGDSQSRPKLLLHSCCAPCSSYCLVYLREYFDITCYFYNPNISDVTEYFKRLAELERLANILNCEMENNGPAVPLGNDFPLLLKAGGKVFPAPTGPSGNIKNSEVEDIPAPTDPCENGTIRVLDGGFDSASFFSAVKGMENIPEGGRRCEECFSLRLSKAANAAKLGDFDYFTSTLTISPLKDEQAINRIGMKIGEDMGVKWLPSDFRKREAIRSQ